ncbi:MAG: hypothetical protein ACE5IE_05685 [Dehalococcoidia bacterium]
MINVVYELEFDYQSVGTSRIKRPMVALRISAGPNYQDTLAMVDSGADYSIFHADHAEALGLKLTDPKPLIGLDGKKFYGYLHHVAMRLLIAPEAWQTIRAEVIFRENHPKDLGNLLGRHDFFRALKVGFDERRQKVYLGQA